MPLFVFTGFKEDNLAKHEKLLPMLMLWASEVSKEGLAQVLVVTNYSMLSDNVSRYLPNRVESLELHDVNFDVAVEVQYPLRVCCCCGTPLALQLAVRASAHARGRGAHRRHRVGSDRG